ncbi:MAG TPA: pyrroline-5-carboxylate reductase [Burkholderiaceae bacterium]|nr:pyrroline-5-carboxylate reductase [Burkholderiaceae bacterium]
MHRETRAGGLAFIGGGNMASAIIGGLIKSGHPAGEIQVVEPDASARARLERDLGVLTLAAPTAELARAQAVVWAVKPQVLREAALAARGHVPHALHLSVAAGIRSGDLARWLGGERIVRAMPNTPALVGRGISGLFARAAVTAQDRATVERLLAPTGAHLWVAREEDLDAVTALSGSGPAYVFYFLEAMQRAGAAMGLPPEQALTLAIHTFAGAAQLAQDADEPPATLRERVTSKGGTTYAALQSLRASRVAEHFESALFAAKQRAAEMGDEFGSD